MSFCRWSSDGYNCDLYVYASVDGGYAIHIAKTRHVHPDGLPCPLLSDYWSDSDTVLTASKLADWRHAEDKWLLQTKLVSIDHPDAGSSFMLDTASECVDAMLELRANGFRFPDSALQDIRDEIQDEDTVSVSAAPTMQPSTPATPRIDELFSILLTLEDDLKKLKDSVSLNLSIVQDTLSKVTALVVADNAAIDLDTGTIDLDKDMS